MNFIINALLLKLFTLSTLVHSYSPKQYSDRLQSDVIYRYGVHPKYVLVDRQRQNQNQRPVTYQVYENHSPQYAGKNVPYRRQQSTTERIKPKESIPHQWTAPVSNAIEESNENVESPNSEGSFSSFGRKTPRQGKAYVKAGGWATPSPDSGIKHDFVPIQTYSQVRNSNTVKHVPRSEAFKDATSYEEILNAPRLKEVLRTKKVQEVYSEEGYEDSGYDHGGHERFAEHDEGYAQKDDAHFRAKDANGEASNDSVNEETQEVPSKKLKQELAPENREDHPEPRITRSRTESSSMSLEYSKAPDNYKGPHKYSSKIKGKSQKTEDTKGFEFSTTEQSKGWSFPTVFDEITTEAPPLRNDYVIIPPKPTARVVFPPPVKSKSSNKTTSYRSIPKVSEKVTKKILKTHSNSTLEKKPEKTTNHTYKYHRTYSKPNRTRIPYKPRKLSEKYEKEDEQQGHRIVLPTIGYINSLTTAHFAQGNPKPEETNLRALTMTSPLNLTEALQFLRLGKLGVNTWIGEPVQDTQPFEPMKIKIARHNYDTSTTKLKREIRSVRQDRPYYDQHDDVEGDLAHDAKTDEVIEEEKQRLQEEQREKEKYEKELSEEISKQEKDIIRQTFGTLEINQDMEFNVPEFSTMPPISIKFQEINAPTTKMPPVNTRKYPFYYSKSLPRDSPLRYATHPGYFPKKSGHRMEFYESRDRLIECPDVNLDLEDIPKSNSTQELKKQPGENPRIVGLGDKISCLKMKYFDEDPLDSPFFRETKIDSSSHKQFFPMTSWGSNDLYHAGSEVKNKPYDRIITATTPKPTPTITTTTQKPNETLRFHGLYQYQPNRTVQIFVRDQKTSHNSPQENRLTYEAKLPLHNESVSVESKRYPTKYFPDKTRSNTKERIIPVMENVDEPPSNYIIKMTRTVTDHNPPPVKKKIRPYVVRRFIIPVRIAEVVPRIVIPQNCMSSIKNMAVLEKSANLIVDCKDATLIQELRQGGRHVKVIPKLLEPKKAENKRSISNIKRYQPTTPKRHLNDWIPMVSYPGRFVTNSRPMSPYAVVSRKSDEIDNPKNDTQTSTSTDHYNIDELNEDDQVRKGEVIEDKEHFMKLMEEPPKANATSTEAPEEAPTEKPSRKKRQIEPGKRKKSKLFLNRALLDKIVWRRLPTKRKPGDEDLGVSSPDSETSSSTTSSTAATTTTTTTKMTTTTTALASTTLKHDTEVKPNRTNTLLSQKTLPYPKKKFQHNEVSEDTASITTDAEKLKNTKILKRVRLRGRSRQPEEEDKTTMSSVISDTSDAESEIATASGHHIYKTDHPTLYYIVDEKTGTGKWLSEYHE